MARPAGNKPPKTFREALQRLEAIVRQIEEGEIELEEAIERYEEGMALVAHCRKLLSDAEAKIEALHAAADGTPETEPFTPPTDDSGESAEG